MSFAFRLLAAVLLCQSTYGAEKLTLDEVLSLGLRANTSVLKEEQNVFIAKQQVRESRLLFLPSIVLSADFARGYIEAPLYFNRENILKYIDKTYDGRDYYGISGSVILPIYTGGRLRKALEFSKLNYSKSRSILEAEYEKTSLEIKKAFYKALYCDKIVSEIEKTYPIIENLFSKIQEKSADYFEASKIKYEMESARSEAEREKYNALKDLKVLILKVNDFDVQGDFEPLCERECNQHYMALSAVNNSARLKSNIYQSSMDALSVEMALRRKYPDVFLGYSTIVSASSISTLSTDKRLDSNAVFLSLNLPINYDFWTQIQKKKARERIGEIEMIASKEEIKDKAERYCYDHNYYCKRIKEKEKKISKMEDLVSQYSNPPLLVMKRMKILFELKKDYYRDIYAQRVSAFELEKFLDK